jgi:serine/threonine protein kinase
VDAATPVDGTSAAQAPDGRTVGARYTLQSSVGSGGMGTVWRAFDELLRREVAVKEVLLPPGIPAPERSVLCERTLREARAAAALNHPSVIRVYDVVNDGDRPWIVMELLDAASLADTLRDEGPLAYDRVAEIGLAVLGALEAAHRVGVLHRDVKPGNVLLGTDGRVTLTDFGVARSPNESPLTSTGLLLGSPQYIAPERARGRPFGPSSDLFSLGATLYTAVEGRPPFDRGDPLPTMTAVVVEPPDQMAFAGPLMPVLLGLLEKDPQQRWDAEKTRNGLRTVLGGGRITALDGRAPRQSRSAGRSRREEASANPGVPNSNVNAKPFAAPGAPPPPPAGAMSERPAPPAPPGAPPAGPELPETPGQRPTPEGTAAMAVGPFSTEGIPSVPADEPGSEASASGGRAGGSHSGSAAVRGSVSVPGAGPKQAAGQASWQQGSPFAASARVPGTQPQQGYGNYSPNYGEPGNATAPIPSTAPPASSPRRQAYFDGGSGRAGGHTMVAPQPTLEAEPNPRKTMLIVVGVVVAVVLIGIVSYLVSIATSGDDKAAPSGTASTQASVALTSYDFPDRGYSLEAPTGWKKKEAGSYVDFVSPQDDKIRALVEDGSSPKSKVNAAESYQKQQLSNGKSTAFKTLDKAETQTKLDGQETWEWRWTYTSASDNVARRVLWRVAVVDGKAYSLYLSAPEKRYDADLATFEQVAKTFKLA